MATGSNLPTFVLLNAGLFTVFSGVEDIPLLIKPPFLVYLLISSCILWKDLYFNRKALVDFDSWDWKNDIVPSIRKQPRYQ